MSQKLNVLTCCTGDFALRSSPRFEQSEVQITVSRDEGQRCELPETAI